MNQPLSIVFVIDDDHSVRRALRRLIRSVGLQFELFGSAREFLGEGTPRHTQLYDPRHQVAGNEWA
jgi:FixJ family two-component response regulator